MSDQHPDESMTRDGRVADGADAGVRPAHTPGSPGEARGDAPGDVHASGAGVARDPVDAPGDVRADTSGETAEEELRRLLREAVDALEPSPDALARLQRAVPARRRRRRMVVATVAAVAVAGVTLPVALHSGVVAGLSGDRTSTTAHGGGTPQTHGGEHPSGGQQQHTDPAPRGSGDTGATGGGPSADATPSAGAPDSPDQGQTFGVSPSCSREQLADGGSGSQPADASGRISGSFVVVNTSDEPCTINDPGLVAATVQGDTERASVQVLDHTGDLAAAGLPAPEEERDELVLRPREAYVIRFVWLPREGGGPSGCRDDAAATGGGDASAGTDPSHTAAADAPGGADGEGDVSGTSVLLGYTPGAGEPRISTVTLAGACAGTVYRTGVLPVGS